MTRRPAYAFELGCESRIEPRSELVGNSQGNLKSPANRFSGLANTRPAGRLRRRFPTLGEKEPAAGKAHADIHAGHGLRSSGKLVVAFRRLSGSRNSTGIIASLRNDDRIRQFPWFPVRHQLVTKTVTNLAKPVKSLSMESHYRRDSLEITDLRRLLRLHGMQEVRGSSPLSSTRKSLFGKHLETSTSEAISTFFRISSPTCHQPGFSLRSNRLEDHSHIGCRSITV